MSDAFNRALPEVSDVGPDQLHQLIKDDSDPRLKVVFFWGPKCPNCDTFKQALPGLLEKMRNWPVHILRSNAYAHRDMATDFGLRGIPTFLLYRDGRRLGRMSQYRGEEFFLGVLGENLPSGQTVNKYAPPAEGQPAKTPPKLSLVGD